MIADPKGFTLVELLVAATITLTVTAALLAAMSPADGIFSSELEAADQQQRLRVSSGVFVRDLVMSELVLPYRSSRTSGDPPGTFRADAVTVVYASSHARATLANALAAESGQARVNIGPGCPLNDLVCGLSRASTALLSDDSKSFDAFRIDDVQEEVLVLRHTMTDSAKTYAPGSRLVEAVFRSYFLKVDMTTDSIQLVRDDGGGPVPVVDHVVGLRLEYFGGASNTESLDATRLTDGPWLPDAAAANRFDADLLHVRSIAVTLRVESALASLRGPAGPLFSRGGTSRRGSRFLPDFQIRVHVSPRNIGNMS